MKKAHYFLLSLFILFTHTAIAEPLLTNLQGETIRFSSLKGKWVFINYWASWCEPCLNEIPELNQFASQNQKQAILYAVNFDDLPLKQQLTLIRKHHIQYQSLMNDPAQSLKLGDVTGVPVTFVFNPQGKLSTTLYGPQSVKTLKRVMTATM